MTLTQPLAERILGSRTLAALTSPHGVDRYLEQINPMWAATEVRARVVDITRETVRRAPGRDPHAAADQHLARTPRRPVRPGRRRDQRRPAYDAVLLDLLGRVRPGRAVHHHRARPRGGEPGQQRVSKFLVREAQPGQILHLSQAEGEFTLTESPATPTNNHLLMISGGSGITPVMSQVRTLLRDGYDGRANRKVTFLHYARSRGGPDLRRGAAPDLVGRTTTSTCTCATATRSSAPSRWPGWCPTTATPTPGPAARRR